MLEINQEGLFLATSYLIPGYLINTILTNRFNFNSKSGTDSLFKYLIFSYINILFYSIIDYLSYLLFSSQLITNQMLVVFLRNIVSPFAISLLILIFFQENGDLGLLGLVKLSGFDKISKIETAWDYIFDLKNNTGCYMIVYLQSGKKIYGLFANKSFASYKNSGKNSIYLERTYEDFIDFKECQYGALISDEQISYICIHEKLERKKIE